MKQNLRFDFYANTINGATKYLLSRSKQLLKLNFKLFKIEEFQWGVIAFFKHKNKIYQSIYILNNFRGRGIYKQNILHPIITTEECGIIDFLDKNKIDYKSVEVNPFQEYKLISNFYTNQKTKRSKIELMNHIDEGLYILEKLKSSETAKKAFCLHPIFQADKDLFKNYNLIHSIDVQTIIATIEYRSVANEYLSHIKVKSHKEIRISVLKDVNDMLIADKIQNRKDFEIYHLKTHKRRNELKKYFENWFKALKISEKFYKECFHYCTQDLDYEAV